MLWYHFQESPNPSIGRDGKRGNGKESSRVDRFLLDAGSASLAMLVILASFGHFVFLIRILNKTLPYTQQSPFSSEVVRSS